MALYCPKCGSRNKQDALICSNCGTALNKKNTTPPKRDGNAIYISIAVFVIIIFMAAILYPLLTRSSGFLSFIDGILNIKPSSATSSNANSFVQITGVDLYTNEYDNLTNSYQNFTKSYAGLNESMNSTFPYTISFVNNGTSSYTITSITSDTSGFSVSNVTPNLPYVVTPGSNLLATLTLNTPESKFAGTLKLLVYGTTTSGVPIKYGIARITVVNENLNTLNNATSTYSNHTKVYAGFNVSSNSVFPFPLTFSNNGTSRLTINKIIVNTPGFEIVNTSPALPYVIGPGSSIGITSYLRSPSSNYTGALDLSVLANETSKKVVSQNRTNITAVNIETSMYDNSTGTFANHTNAYTGFSLNSSAAFSYTLITANNYSTGEVIKSITATTKGFKLLGTNPLLPYPLPSYSNIGITTNIEDPVLNYTGVLDLLVSGVLTGTASTTTSTTMPSTTTVPPTTIPIANQTTITQVLFKLSTYNNSTKKYSNTTVTSGGFSEQANSKFPYAILFANSGNVPYAVYSIETVTSGFGITSMNPDTPFNVSSGSNRTESLEITTPSSSYNGNLTIEAFAKIADPPSNTDPPSNATNTIHIGSIKVKTIYSDNGIYSNTTVSFRGTNESSGSSFPYSVEIPNNSPISLTVNSITSGTSGFAISGITPSLPINIPSESRANESFTVDTPTTQYSGNLTILIYETSG